MGSSCCCNCCLLACCGLGFTYAWEAVREGEEWEEYWESSKIVSRRIRPMVTDLGDVEEEGKGVEERPEDEGWEEYWEDSKIVLKRTPPIVVDTGDVKREEEVDEGVDQEMEEAEEGVDQEDQEEAEDEVDDDEVQEEVQARGGEEEEGVPEEVMGEEEEAEEEWEWEEDEDGDLAEALEQSMEEYKPNMVPASEAAIASLEKVIEGGEVLGLSCVVCMDDKNEPEFSRLPCNHIFHTKCIETWLRISSCCPLCKYVMP